MIQRVYAIAFGCLMILGMPLRPSAQANMRALEPDQAGPDFPLQGEYLGESGDGKSVLAAQVAALGDGAFKVAILPGGFPGAGYAGTGRVNASGSRTSGKLQITGTGWQGSGDGTELKGTGPGGVTFALRRVERKSPTLGLQAPEGAKVLFDGKDISAWGATAAIDSRGFLGVPSETKAKYGSFSVHLEFRLAFEPAGRGQARSNSGFCMTTSSWSELQILDSFGDEPLADGCGALYNVAKPLVTANYPPLAWQTYDIRYVAPTIKAGDTVGQGTLTAWLNGVLVQDKTPLKNRPAASTILLQDHTHPVFYRNIWMVDGKADFDFLGAVSLRPRNSRGAPAAAPRAAAILLPGYHVGYLSGGDVRGADGRAAKSPSLDRGR